MSHNSVLLRRLITIVSIAGTVTALVQPALAGPPPAGGTPSAAAKANPPKVRPTFHGTPPAGYPAAKKAPTVKPSVPQTPDTVTNPQGDTLSVTGASPGSLTSSSGFWTDEINGIYFEDCTRPGLGYGGNQLPFCGYVQ